MVKILLEDFESIANSDLKFEEYKGSIFLITGATGLIGSLLVKALLFCSNQLKLDLKVIAVVRNLEKAKEIYGEFKEDALQFYVCDLAEDDFDVKESVDYIVHAAAITQSKLMVSNPVDLIKTAVNSTTKVLDLAVEKKVKGCVYISSMEVYGVVNSISLLPENELGQIDLTAVRSCYPESKRLCECMCKAYASQYGLNVKVARLAQTFGAGVLQNENRVFAQFARSIIQGKDIVLHTKGRSEGNYVYTTDAIIAILMLLTDGVKGEAYNISNEKSHTTIASMAHLVCDNFGNSKSKVVFDLPEDDFVYGYAPDTKMHLCSEKMRELGWKPQVDLLEAYRRLIEYLNDGLNDLCK